MTQASSTQTPASDSSLLDPSDLDRLRQPRKTEPSNWVYAFIAAVVVIISYIGYDQYNKYSANQAAIAKKAVAEQRAAEEQRTNEIADLKAKLEAAEAKLKAAVTPSPAAVPAPSEAPKTTAFTGWGVVTGTLFNLNQRADSAAKNANAFSVCLNDGKALKPCFIEVGNKSHTNFTTEFVAVPENPLTEAQARALATCFNDNLPLVDSDNGTTKKVGAFATNLSSRRYAGRVCITP